MSIWIRKISGDASENHLNLAENNWDLRDLFKEFNRWITEDAITLDDGHKWIVDIGFSPRKNASGGGPIISPEIMKICAEKNISIYLSEYDDRNENS